MEDRVKSVPAAVQSGVRAMNATFALENVPIDHRALDFAVPLLSSYGDTCECIGSGFLACPGIAFAASHVVEEWQRHGRFAIVALQLIENAAYPWEVESISHLWTADIAILQLRRPPWWEERKAGLRFPRLSVNPPLPGDQVRVFGFPRSSIADGILKIEPMECVARVREVELKANPSHFRPTSYVELDGEIAAGMSGGPCFDRDWNIVGMCSKGLNEQPSGLPPFSIMALLWPAMGLKIDLFKTGQFPVWDLFNKGPAEAVGSRRVQLTSAGTVRLGRVDPSSLVETPHRDDEEILRGAIRFAAENARRAMVELRGPVSSTGDSTSNEIHQYLRCFFWELESAIALAMRCAALRVGFILEKPSSWDDFLARWHGCQPSPSIRDRLAALGFSWNGPALFELRAFGDRARCGVLTVTRVVEGEKVHSTQLASCRVGGAQMDLPDGLEQYFSATRQFVQAVLRLSHEQKGDVSS